MPSPTTKTTNVKTLLPTVTGLPATPVVHRHHACWRGKKLRLGYKTRINSSKTPYGPSSAVGPTLQRLQLFRDLASHRFIIL